MELSIKEILDLGWSDEEKDVIKRSLEHFNSWRRWLPKSLEKDIQFIIELAIKEKQKINALLSS